MSNTEGKPNTLATRSLATLRSKSDGYILPEDRALWERFAKAARRDDRTLKGAMRLILRTYAETVEERDAG